jgi:hypothetical protein
MSLMRMSFQFMLKMRVLTKTHAVMSAYASVDELVLGSGITSFSDFS